MRRRIFCSAGNGDDNSRVQESVFFDHCIFAFLLPADINIILSISQFNLSKNSNNLIHLTLRLLHTLGIFGLTGLLLGLSEVTTAQALHLLTRLGTDRPPRSFYSGLQGQEIFPGCLRLLALITIKGNEHFFIGFSPFCQPIILHTNFVEYFIRCDKQSLINKRFKVLPQTWKNIGRIMICMEVNQCRCIYAVAFSQSELDQI